MGLLVLTRRVGEKLRIGDDIEIVVLGVKGNQCRVGVSAPKEVAVHREEIYQRIKREETGASTPQPTITQRKAPGQFFQGARVTHA